MWGRKLSDVFLAPHLLVQTDRWNSTKSIKLHVPLRFFVFYPFIGKISLANYCRILMQELYRIVLMTLFNSS